MQHYVLSTVNQIYKYNICHYEKIIYSEPNITKKYKHIVCCYEQHKICSEPNSTKNKYNVCCYEKIICNEPNITKNIKILYASMQRSSEPNITKKYKDIVC